MLILSIETSHRSGAVALLESGTDTARLLEEISLEPLQGKPAKRTAQTLLPAIGELLARRDATPADVGLLCVTGGPGSFTGLRIGITTAKTFAYATHCPLVAVHTLAALAEPIPPCPSRLWAIADAQRGELFCSVFPEDTDLKTSPWSETLTLPADQWLAILQTGDTVVGPPLAKLTDRLPKDVTAATPELCEVSAAAVGRLGFRLFQAGRTDDPLQLVPRYYRKSAAEEKADKKAQAQEHSP